MWPPRPPPARPIERFGDLVAAGESALSDGRLAEPPGDNALDYYLTILAVDPQHAIAQQRLSTVTQALFTQAESALLGDSLDSAGALLAHLRRADPSSPRLTFLEAQLADERREASTTVAVPPPRQRAAPAAATPAPAAAEQSARTEIKSLLAIARARIARGALLTPDGDSAAHYLDSAIRLDSADPAVQTVSVELGAALAEAARTALREGNIDGANSALEQAQRYGGWQRVVKLAADVAAARDTQAARRALDARDWSAGESRGRSARAQHSRSAAVTALAAARARLQQGAAAIPRDRDPGQRPAAGEVRAPRLSARRARGRHRRLGGRRVRGRRHGWGSRRDRRRRRAARPFRPSGRRRHQRVSLRAVRGEWPGL